MIVLEKLGDAAVPRTGARVMLRMTIAAVFALGGCARRVAVNGPGRGGRRPGLRRDRAIHRGPYRDR